VEKHGRIPVLFLRASLFFLVLSTLGTLALGPIIAAGMKGTALYYGSIQFYLHFQFNGWFVFAIISILFMWLKSLNIKINTRGGVVFFWTLVIATALTYALAVSWSTPYFFIFMINSVGVLVQLLALGLFAKLLYEAKIQVSSFAIPYVYKVLVLVFVVFVLKILVQTVVVIPFLAEVSYSIRNLVIGFIHLLMLGGLSLFAFAMISSILGRPLHIFGTILFIIGIFLTEVLLFGQGLMQWQGWGIMNYYYEMIAAASSIIIVGIAMIIYNVYYQSKHSR
jgi:hypothetical protein